MTDSFPAFDLNVRLEDEDNNVRLEDDSNGNVILCLRFALLA